jgi:hypothetical protein
MLVIKHFEGQLHVQFCLPALVEGNMKRNDMFVLFVAALADIFDKDIRCLGPLQVQ